MMCGWLGHHLGQLRLDPTGIFLGVQRTCRITHPRMAGEKHPLTFFHSSLVESCPGAAKCPTLLSWAGSEKRRIPPTHWEDCWEQDHSGYWVPGELVPCLQLPHLKSEWGWEASGTIQDGNSVRKIHQKSVYLHYSSKECKSQQQISSSDEFKVIFKMITLFLLNFV